jgi:hypothetical protein
MPEPLDDESSAERKTRLEIEKLEHEVAKLPALIALWEGDIADRGSDAAFLRRAIEEAATE